MKYELPNNQGEVLPNLLGLTTEAAIGVAEFEGFLNADILLTERLHARTKFSTTYITNIHKLALSRLYAFAGKLRDVNISKSGFVFPSALFLPDTMRIFQSEVLEKLPHKYTQKELLIRDIATVHGELLFIHPFREGNGRTARVLANLMARKQGYGGFDFTPLAAAEAFKAYVLAIQACAEQEYTPMENLMSELFQV